MNTEINEQIQFCQSLSSGNGRVPCVFKANTLYGKTHVGVCFAPEGSQVGDRFHCDHGVGIEQNKDAEIIWLKE